jgi:hypothetical protein
MTWQSREFTILISMSIPGLPQLDYEIRNDEWSGIAVVKGEPRLAPTGMTMGFSL